jgi:hypothetical protein
MPDCAGMTGNAAGGDQAHRGAARSGTILEDSSARFGLVIPGSRDPAALSRNALDARLRGHDSKEPVDDAG